MLSDQDRALIERVMGPPLREYGPNDVTGISMSQIAELLDAAREEGRQTSGERVEQEAWSYDLSAIPNGPIEVAFDGGLGMCNIQVCERRIVGPTLVDNGHPVPSDRLERAFFVEGARIPDRGWRAYAWRRPTIPPLSPQAAPVERKPLISPPTTFAEQAAFELSHRGIAPVEQGEGAS